MTVNKMLLYRIVCMTQRQ